MTTTYLNILKAETYKDKEGMVQTNFTKVGVARAHKSGNGFSVRIITGLAVSGDLVILPPKSKSEEDESQNF